MTIDWSKGTSMHRMYGHTVFVIEARSQGKNETFIKNVCTNLKCKEHHHGK